MDYWIQISSGRGPAECGWVVSQVLRMMQAKAEKEGLLCEVLERVPDREPGTLQSALLSLSGDGADCMLEQWEGTICWHGKSPFRPQHKRANWYVGVSAIPLPEESADRSGDICFEPIKASGPGGQHVNNNNTAIRATHNESGLQVVAREERSQERNRKLALARLLALLDQRLTDQKRAAKHARWDLHNRLERGNPRRVYEGRRFRLRHR